MDGIDREAWRSLELERLNGIEQRVMQMAAATGRDCGELLRKVRADRARLDGTAPPIRVVVQVPAGATAEQKRQAVANAIVAAGLRQDEDHTLVDPLEDS